MACFLALFNPPGTCIINFTCDFGDNKNKIVQVHIFDNIMNRGRGEHGINLVRKWKSVRWIWLVPSVSVLRHDLI